MRLLGAVSFLLRRIRVEYGAALLVVLLVVVTSFAAASGPRLFNRVADEGLRYQVREASVVERNFLLSTVDRLPARGATGVERVQERGVALETQMPASVRQLIEARTFVIDSPRFGLADPPNYTTFVILRYQDGLEDQIDLVQGRLPRRARQPIVENFTDPPPTRLEIAISEATAAETLLEVGDRLIAVVDPQDPLLSSVFPRPEVAVELVVVGVFGIRDPSAAYWYADPSLIRPSIGGTDDFPIAFATGLVAPEAYGDVLGLGLPFRYQWRYRLATDQLDAGQLDQLGADLRQMESIFATSISAALASRVVFLRTGLIGLIETYEAQRATSEAVLSVAAIGPLAVAAGAVGVVAILVVSRRRASLALARGRGASGGQVLAAQLWEGLLLTVPAAVAGLLLAETAIPARPSDASSPAAGSVALGASLLLLAATWPIARRALGRLERDDPPVLRLAPRRLVLETTVVGLALTGAWLLRERGLTAETTAESGGWDPFLAAAPVLVGIAVGLLTLRLYPLPVRALGWLAARRRDLVPVLGLRNIGRHPAGAHLPLLALMLTIAIGAFSSVITVSIERAQLEAAWREVGADYRIEPGAGGTVALDPDLAGVEGVEAVAPGFIDRSADFVGQPGLESSTLLYAVDIAAYQAVVADAPLPDAALLELAGAAAEPGAGTPDRPIPAVISRRAPPGTGALRLGDPFELTVFGRRLTFTVAGFRDAFPGISAGSTFVIAPFEAVLAGRGPALRPNLLLVRGSAAAEPRLRARLVERSPSAVIFSRHARYAEMRDAPLVAAVGGGFAIALGAAAAYASLAVLAAMTLTAERRGRDMAYLRTLGLTRGQVLGLTVVEHAPPVALALAVGIGLGIGLAWLLAPGLELAAFIGPGASVPLLVDWGSIGAVTAALVVIAVTAVAISSWLAGRLALPQALRLGDE